MRANQWSKVETPLNRGELKQGAALLQPAAVASFPDAVSVTSASPAPAAAVAGPMLAAAPALAGPALAPAPALAGPVLAAAPEVAEPVLEPVRRFSKGREAPILDSRAWTRARLVADTTMLSLASAGALLSSGSREARSHWWLAAGFALLTLALIRRGRNPDQRLRPSAVDAVAHVLGVISLSAMLTVAAASILGTDHPVAFAVHLWLPAAGCVAVARLVLLWYRRYALANQALATPTLIVGAGDVGARLAMRLFADPGYGLRPVGFLDTTPMPRSDRVRTPLVPVLGGPADLIEAVTRTGARHVILAFTSESDHVLVAKVKECQALGVEVSVMPRMYEAINERVAVDHVGGLPLLSLRRTDPHGWQFGIKHALDRGLAVLALAAIAPVMIAVAITVRVTSPGPVLFRQRRVGRDGREFEVLKFRTMFKVDSTRRFVPPQGCAPGGVEGEDRRTPIGRWLRGASLDELPQLLNVIRGEMSLVGPRPERPEFVARFGDEIDRYRDRHRVKSGITGWAQVNGLRGQTSIADRVEWDNYYIENWSLRFDLRIMVLTVAEVFRLRDTALCDARK